MQPLPKAKTYPQDFSPWQTVALQNLGRCKAMQSLWRLLRLLRLRCLSFQPRCRCLTRPTSSARDLQLDARGAQKGRVAWLSHRPLHGSNVSYLGSVRNMKSHEISRAILQVTNPTIRELSKHFTIIHNHSQNRCITCPTHLSLHISWDRSSGLEGSIFKTANTLTCLSNFIQRNLPKRSKNIKDLTISPSHHNSPPVTAIFRNFFVVFVCHLGCAVQGHTAYIYEARTIKEFWSDQWIHCASPFSCFSCTHCWPKHSQNLHKYHWCDDIC